MEAEAVTRETVQAALERVLASATFRGAERSRTLLRFIVEQTLEGKADRLKDYTLGAEALGRGDQFDPRTDPIARVEASRLRSRLDVYYATDGASDPVRISLPKGAYVPVFETRATEAVPPVEQDDGEVAADTRPTRVPFKTLLAAVVVLVSMAGAVWLLMHRSPSAPTAGELHLEITTPATTDPVSLAISPDGRAVVFVASDDRHARLWVRPLDSSSPRQLAGTDNASLPFWAPDGRSIGFFADGKIKRIDLESGLVRIISTAPVPAGAAWSRDGVLLHPVVPDGPLFRASDTGPALTTATRLTRGQTGHRAPAFLPDGRHFLFFAAGDPAVKGIYIGELGTTVARRLTDADAPAVFAAPNHVLYVQHSKLLAQRIDLERFALLGEPFALADDIALEPGAGLAAVAASATGTILYRSGPAGGQRQFVWVDRAGKEVSRIGTPEPRGPSYASMSPDHRRLAMQRTVDGNTDIWILDLERGLSIRFTSEPQADIAPVWSPRGDRIVYASQGGGVFDLFERAMDGSPSKLLLHSSQSKQATDWSRDGRSILFRTVAIMPNPDNDIWAMSAEADAMPQAIVRTPFEERDAQFSPDGRWIAYQSNDSGQHEVYVQPFREPGERVRISTDGGVQVRWRADGEELFYLTLQGALNAVPVHVRGDGGLRAGTPVPLFQTSIGSVQGVSLPNYIAAPDGRRFLMDTVVEAAAAPISVIVNWTGHGK
jgi:Tol biopolymer transport system component